MSCKPFHPPFGNLRAIALGSFFSLRFAPMLHLVVVLHYRELSSDIAEGLMRPRASYQKSRAGVPAAANRNNGKSRGGVLAVCRVRANRQECGKLSHPKI